jgi:hypothetical protein
MKKFSTIIIFISFLFLNVQVSYAKHYKNVSISECIKDELSAPVDEETEYKNKLEVDSMSEEEILNSKTSTKEKLKDVGLTSVGIVLSPVLIPVVIPSMIYGLSGIGTGTHDNGNTQVDFSN